MTSGKEKNPKTRRARLAAAHDPSDRCRLRLPGQRCLAQPVGQARFSAPSGRLTVLGPRLVAKAIGLGDGPNLGLGSFFHFAPPSSRLRRIGKERIRPPVSQVKRSRISGRATPGGGLPVAGASALDKERMRHVLEAAGDLGSPLPGLRGGRSPFDRGPWCRVQMSRGLWRRVPGHCVHRGHASKRGVPPGRDGLRGIVSRRKVRAALLFAARDERKRHRQDQLCFPSC